MIEYRNFLSDKSSEWKFAPRDNQRGKFHIFANSNRIESKKTCLASPPTSAMSNLEIKNVERLFHLNIFQLFSPSIFLFLFFPLFDRSTFGGSHHFPVQDVMKHLERNLLFDRVDISFFKECRKSLGSLCRGEERRGALSLLILWNVNEQGRLISYIVFYPWYCFSSTKNNII